MPLIRRLSGLLIVVAFATGCVAASPGWTYAPAPSATPQPSGEPSTEPSGPPPSTDPNLVTVSAMNIAFEQSSLTAPADTPFKIEFENRDAGTPHNVAIHEDSPTGPEAFVGDVFPGVETRTYDVPALAAGTYAFVCTVHPSMTGTLTVQ